jgi:two-component system sensor histidine kinase CpxA
VHAYFFSADDVKFFTAKNVAPEIQKLAIIAFREDGLHAFGTFASQRITDTEGRKYALVIVFAQDTATIKSRLLLFQVPIIMLAAAGLFCFLIARHVTAPLIRLSSAAEAIAEGRLNTRVGLDLQKRRDEIAALARDFDRMAERIETLVTSQQDLLANISHELRSPLARLNVALELLKQEGADKNSEHLQRIALEARRLDTLIGHVLLLSRLDSKVLTTAPAAIDLAVITQEVLNDAGFEARAMSRDVVNGVMDNCAINGHEDLLRSAIENVVRNAVRHTPPGTTVEVSLHREMTANQSRGVLRVRDHGPGVPESMLEEIFRPFARVPSSDATNVSGSGLGLAIAQRAVAAHRGSIRAQNAPDGGLVIEIDLPIA